MFHKDSYTNGDATYFDFYRVDENLPWPTNPKKPLKKDLSDWIKFAIKR